MTTTFTTRARHALSTLPRRLRKLALIVALPAALPIAACAADNLMPGHDHGGPNPAPGSPLVERVRAATRQYVDINRAIGEGWVQATPCVSGPNEGAMGVHFLKPDRLDGKLSGDEPEMLIYEPLPGGRFRLVGVEFIVLKDAWFAPGNHPASEAPNVDGHLANFVGEPNRYALPPFYEMHVWAWQDNPNGSFADWNTKVSCERMARPQ